MNHASVTIRFDGNGRVYHPRETLSGVYSFHGLQAGQVKAVEVSVLWYSEGKGDEDLAVHKFWRFQAEDEEPTRPMRSDRFSTVLPRSPLSYDGMIVKICWCVRVRAFLPGGKEVVGERMFRLGDVPPVKVPTS